MQKKYGYFKYRTTDEHISTCILNWLSSTLHFLTLFMLSSVVSSLMSSLSNCLAILCPDVWRKVCFVIYFDLKFLSNQEEAWASCLHNCIIKNGNRWFTSRKHRFTDKVLLLLPHAPLLHWLPVPTFAITVWQSHFTDVRTFFLWFNVKHRT